MISNNQDIFFGLVATACSLAVLSELHLVDVHRYPSAWASIAAPFFWVVCLIAARKASPKPGRRLWWVWVSGPAAFYYWMEIFVSLTSWGA